MAFYNEIPQHTTLTTTHCDNFNEVNQKLLENTLKNHQDIGNLNSLSTTNKNSLVSAMNEVKQSIPSSTNINQTIDQKISTHNQNNESHQDIRSKIINLNDNVYVNRNLPSNKNINDFKEIGYVSLGDTTLLNGDFPHASKESFSWGRLIFDGMHQYLETQNKTPTNPQVLNSMYVRTYYMVQGQWGSWKQLATTEQINVLSSSKLDSMIEKMSQSLVQKLDVGQYHFQNATEGYPEGYTTDNDFVLIVYPSSKGNLDWARLVLFDIRSDRIFVQRRTGGTLKGWKELATTTKTDISITPKTSFQILNQKNCRINNILHINFEIQKTDGSMFAARQFVNVATLPIHVWNTSIHMIGGYAGFFQVSGCGIAYETHLAVVPDRECQYIRISGVVVL